MTTINSVKCLIDLEKHIKVKKTFIANLVKKLEAMIRDMKIIALNWLFKHFYILLNIWLF